ncbi:MAG: Tn3 family transposase [Syntrophobacteraceae bacterium]
MSNAVLVWNTIKIKEIIDHLETNSEVVDREAQSKVLPFCFAHIMSTGTYNFLR